MTFMLEDKSATPYTEEALAQVEAFLKEAHMLARRWIETPVLRASLRMNRRVLAGVAMTCLDITTIEIVPAMRQRGIFSAFVAAVHECHTYQATYLEHAANPIVVAWCSKYGWEQDSSALPPSFYRIKSGTIILRKIDPDYWQAEFQNQTRHHIFPKQGAASTLRNVEILLHHGYQADPSLLAQLRDESSL